MVHTSHIISRCLLVYTQIQLFLLYNLLYHIVAIWAVRSKQCYIIFGLCAIFHLTNLPGRLVSVRNYNKIIMHSFKWTAD